MKATIKIVHVTSVHPRYDTRILYKMCVSLSKKAGYDVALVVADGLGYEVFQDISIYDIGKKSKYRLVRMLETQRLIFHKAISLDGDIYHIHDPELIPAGLKLLKNGKCVVFDSHEDVPIQLLGKPYIWKAFRILVSRIYQTLEKQWCRHFNGIIAATPLIGSKFKTINPNTVPIMNYPMTDEIEPNCHLPGKNKMVCYIGGLSLQRGIAELVNAIGICKTEARLFLAGNFSDSKFLGDLQKLGGWSKVEWGGFVDRGAVRQTLHSSIAGLVTLRPAQNYKEAYPVKLFEYMSAGLPVIASDFPMWRNIIDGCKCGICVDPLNPAEIAEAIDYLVQNPENARVMGVNGRMAIESRFNWRQEEIKLFDFYSQLAANL